MQSPNHCKAGMGGIDDASSIPCSTAGRGALEAEDDVIMLLNGVAPGGGGSPCVSGRNWYGRAAGG